MFNHADVADAGGNQSTVALPECCHGIIAMMADMALSAMQCAHVERCRA